MSKVRIYNQLTKNIEDFNPLDEKNVKIYTCGPTVYSYAHIGNLSSYIYWDFLIRTLTLSGYTVNRVLNLTDVGHLSSDADDGEDKLEKGAKKEGKTVWEIADKYIEAFLNDFRSLNLIEPQKIARATDYIQEDEELVDRLIEKGYTYETSDGIYFDTSKFKTYADFADLDLEKLQAGARVEFSNEKKHVSDFAVWKFVRNGEDHAMQWNYRGRPGYPGWHLECASIIKKELGLPIDIHTGGIDHIPIHHTNEIAEVEAAFDEKLSNYWTHCNFITINGEKISKSLGNVYTLSDLKERGFTPLDYKTWVLQGNYRTARNFTFEDLTSAKNRRLNWRNRIAALYQSSRMEHEKDPNFKKDEVLELAKRNLGSAKILAYIDNSNLSMEDWEYVDELLGLDLINSTPDITKRLISKINAREVARVKHDFRTADQIRDSLVKKNITILDTAEGPIWQYLS
ncbi:cysteine--tRNA ligase [Candidatus Saccharibacteria bacterium]|nr:cysteine--tRNA ligase [Candidatus Saccharibacteria bacterium]